jgi:hypothetical protein
MTYSRFAIVFYFSSTALLAQTFNYGLRGGVPLTNAFQTVTSGVSSIFSDSKGYVFGPTFEVRLPFGLGVEVDALYRPLSYESQNANSTASHTSFGSWEFPVLGKYRFAFPIVKPFVDAGPSFRSLGNGGSFLSGKGFALGAGVEAGLFHVHLSPELRYTHWGTDGAGRPLSILQSGQNQVEFLIGLTF